MSVSFRVMRGRLWAQDFVTSIEGTRVVWADRGPAPKRRKFDKAVAIMRRLEEKGSTETPRYKWARNMATDWMMKPD